MGRSTGTESLTTWLDVVRGRATRTPEREALTFLSDGELNAIRWDYRTLDIRARAVAAALRHTGGKPGERALLLYPPGLEFVAGFLGCLYAGVIAVPAYPPRSADQERAIPRLAGILADARPAVILTSSRSLYTVRECVAAAWSDKASPPPCLDTEILLDASAAEWREPNGIAPDSVAMLQYTSGSTAAPKGVVLTHANLLHNCAAIRDAFGHTHNSRGVIWLPPYHDMGLIGGVLQPLFAGFPVTLMPPAAFLQKPSRWLRAVSDWRATTSGGPDFAYELCARSIKPDERAALDLSRWDLAFTGAEPIRQSTLDRFAEAFASVGFQRKAFYPCYGLAEATLLVTGGTKGDGAASFKLDNDALRDNRVSLSARPHAKELVGCGGPREGVELTIVDPRTLTECPADRVGEIWLRGPGVARGYFNRDEETAETFGATLEGAPAGGGRWLRTGDLGFLAGEQLCITGRIKGLIIIRGRNHYPQDIEHTAGACHDAVRPGGVAAFGAAAGGEAEQLVVYAELERTQRNVDPVEVFEAVRDAVATRHELQAYAIVLLRPGRLPRTSSGKVRRLACRDAFTNGEDLGELARWVAPPAPPAGAAATHEPSAPQAPHPPTSGAGHSNVPKNVGAFPSDSAELERWLAGKLAAAVGVPVGEIDAGEPFARYGLDSASAVALAGQIATELQLDLEATLFWDYPTVQALAAHLSSSSSRPPQGPSAHRAA